MKNTLSLSRSMPSPVQRHRGFTLIEVMIVVVIVGILAAIGVASYQGATIKSNRAAAQAYLLSVSQAQQQYLLDSRSYTATLADLNVPTPTSVSQFYTITIATTAGPPATFTVTATPIAGTKQASDVTLSINNVGEKLPAASW
jgi:type IV pilus assembly protein PilE